MPKAVLHKIHFTCFKTDKLELDRYRLELPCTETDFELALNHFHFMQCQWLSFEWSFGEVNFLCRL